jgi:hypothetical protein
MIAAEERLWSVCHAALRPDHEADHKDDHVHGPEDRNGKAAATATPAPHPGPLSATNRNDTETAPATSRVEQESFSARSRPVPSRPVPSRPNPSPVPPASPTEQETPLSATADIPPAGEAPDSPSFGPASTPAQQS